MPRKINTFSIDKWTICNTIILKRGYKINTLIVLDYTHKDCFPPKMSIGDKRFGANYDEAIAFLRGNSMKKVQFKYLENEPASKAYFEGMFIDCICFCQN